MTCRSYSAHAPRTYNCILNPINSEYYVYEPLTAATLETIASSQSLETSYKRVTAFHAKDIFEGPPSRPTGIQVDKLKVLDQGITAHVSSHRIRLDAHRPVVSVSFVAPIGRGD